MHSNGSISLFSQLTLLLLSTWLSSCVTVAFVAAPNMSKKEISAHNQLLHNDNMRLHEENKELNGENKALKANNSDLQDGINSRDATINTLKFDNGKLTTKVNEQALELVKVGKPLPSEVSKDVEKDIKKWVDGRGFYHWKFVQPQDEKKFMQECYDYCCSV